MGMHGINVGVGIWEDMRWDGVGRDGMWRGRVGGDGVGWGGALFSGSAGIGMTASAELVHGYSVYSTTYRHTAQAELHELDVYPQLLVERREHAHLHKQTRESAGAVRPQRQGATPLRVWCPATAGASCAREDISHAAR